MDTNKIYHKISFTLLAIVLLTACPNIEQITEPAGHARYFIHNQTGIDLYYGIGQQAIKIEPNNIKQIFQDGDFGIKAPLPSDGLGGRLRLYSDRQGSIAIEQEPIDDSFWLEEKQDDQYYGLVHYTLTATAVMLQ